MWRHGESMCALLFSFCVCVRLGPCHSVPGPRDLHAHLALTLWKSSLSPKARDLCYDSWLCQAFTNYTRRYNGLLSGAQPLTGAATVICESLPRRRRRALYLRNANNVPPNQTTATITADWIFLPFFASHECEVSTKCNFSPSEVATSSEWWLWLSARAEVPLVEVRYIKNSRFGPTVALL